MYYALHSMQSAAVWPLRLCNSQMLKAIEGPFSPWRGTMLSRSMSAAGQVFEHVTRRYGRPRFGAFDLTINGRKSLVRTRMVKSKPFANLLHFSCEDSPEDLPCVLVVAPMAGHFATLLRGTVERLIPEADVYITEWRDARDVALMAGDFGFFDYLDYLHDFLVHLGQRVHVVAVCQPTVPAYLLTAWMEARGSAVQPMSLTLIGGPVDPMQGATSVTEAAASHSLTWFRQNVIDFVPWPYAGLGRRVYPGFLQLNNFMSMNTDRHIEAHFEMYRALVVGDEETAQKRRAFYEEYRTVMDLTEKFFLQTLDIVFQRRLLTSDGVEYHGQTVRVSDIVRTPLLVVEGERDDICGVGQTSAALDMSYRLPKKHRHYWLQKGVGHYGLFNGRRFREDIAPRILDFIGRYQQSPIS